MCRQPIWGQQGAVREQPFKGKGNTSGPLKSTCPGAAGASPLWGRCKEPEEGMMGKRYIPIPEVPSPYHMGTKVQEEEEKEGQE